jgi:hypothetical protein
VPARAGTQPSTERPASAMSNRPVAAPRFASEIAEEQAQQAAASGRHGAAPPTPAHAARPAEATSPLPQAREDVAPVSPAPSQHANAAERPAAPVHPSRVAEMEDQQLDVPAYLRRNDL